MDEKKRKWEGEEGGSGPLKKKGKVEEKEKSEWEVTKLLEDERILVVLKPQGLAVSYYPFSFSFFSFLFFFFFLSFFSFSYFSFCFLLFCFLIPFPQRPKEPKSVSKNKTTSFSLSPALSPLPSPPQLETNPL